MLSILDTLPESVPSFGPNPTLTLQNHFSSWFDYLMPATHASFTFTLNRNSGAFSNTSNRGGLQPASSAPIPVNDGTPSPPGSHSWIFKLRFVTSGRPPGLIHHNNSLSINRDLLSQSFASSRDVLFFLRGGTQYSTVFSA